MPKARTFPLVAQRSEIFGSSLNSRSTTAIRPSSSAWTASLDVPLRVDRVLKASSVFPENFHKTGLNHLSCCFLRLPTVSALGPW